MRTGNLVYFDNTQNAPASRSISWRPARCRRAFRRWRSTANITGTAVWSPIRRSRRSFAKRAQGLLVFQVDLWSARGTLPGNFVDVEERVKDIQYSSRTRIVTDMMRERRSRARVIRELLRALPPESRLDSDTLEQAQSIGSVGSVNIFHLIYQNKAFEAHYKDAEFSRATMVEHWESGRSDMAASLAQPGWLDIPDEGGEFVTHDIHRHRANGDSRPRSGDRLRKGGTAAPAAPGAGDQASPTAS